MHRDTCHACREAGNPRPSVSTRPWTWQRWPQQIRRASPGSGRHGPQRSPTHEGHCCHSLPGLHKYLFQFFMSLLFIITFWTALAVLLLLLPPLLLLSQFFLVHLVGRMETQRYECENHAQGSSKVLPLGLKNSGLTIRLTSMRVWGFFTDSSPVISFTIHSSEFCGKTYVTGLSILVTDHLRKSYMKCEKARFLHILLRSPGWIRALRAREQLLTAISFPASPVQ